jgi:hypothetical protein
VAERVIVLVEDDWELLGNGLGDVAHLQYLPALFLMNLADQLGFKVTFMAETLQQLSMLQIGAKHRRLRAQAALWEESVAMMKERGHDVQLHLHPQWHDAPYTNGFFELNRNWNVAAHEATARRRMIAESVRYLLELLRPLDPQYSVNSFKAGSWGLQPSAGILSDLEDAGIRVVIGPGKGISYITSDFYADYEALEEDVLPYVPDYTDIRKVARTANTLIVIPLPHYTPGIGTFAGKVRRRLFGRRPAAGPKRFFYEDGIPPKHWQLSPMIPARRRGLVSRLAPGGTKSLDVSSASFAEMKLALDQIMARCLRSHATTVPLVIQSHTKGYEDHWDDIAHFFRYLVERYGRSITFQTLTEFQSELPALHVAGRA